MENSTCFLSSMMIRIWFMLSVPKITCFYIFSKEFLKFIRWLTWSINKGQGLNYRIKVASQKFKWSEVKRPILTIFFRLFCFRIFGIFKYFCFAKVKIHFALYEVRNDNSNPGRAESESEKGKLHVNIFPKCTLSFFWK